MSGAELLAKIDAYAAAFSDAQRAAVAGAVPDAERDKVVALRDEIKDEVDKRKDASA